MGMWMGMGWYGWVGSNGGIGEKLPFEVGDGC